jgi:hypothetical protein
MNHRPSLTQLNTWKFKGWNLCGTALVSFAAGSLATGHLTHLREVKADSNRVFQLEIYHAVPGKVPALEERFRSASKLQAKHDLNVVGYWVPINSAPTETDPCSRIRSFISWLMPAKKTPKRTGMGFMPIQPSRSM